jgi:hypothetical protein
VVLELQAHGVGRKLACVAAWMWARGLVVGVGVEVGRERQGSGQTQSHRRSQQRPQPAVPSSCLRAGRPLHLYARQQAQAPRACLGCLPVVVVVVAAARLPRILRRLGRLLLLPLSQPCGQRAGSRNGAGSAFKQDRMPPTGPTGFALESARSSSLTRIPAISVVAHSAVPRTRPSRALPPSLHPSQPAAQAHPAVVERSPGHLATLLPRLPLPHPPPPLAPAPPVILPILEPAISQKRARLLLASFLSRTSFTSLEPLRAMTAMSDVESFSGSTGPALVVVVCVCGGGGGQGADCAGCKPGHGVQRTGG